MLRIQGRIWERGKNVARKLKMEEYSLIADKAAKRHAAPAHASHEGASQRLSAVAIHAVAAVLIVDGDGLRTRAHKGVLP